MKNLLSALLLLGFAYANPTVCVIADDSVPAETMTKIASHLKQRIDDSRDQIDMGLTKGWINADKAAVLKKELDQTYAMESDVRSQNYPKEPLGKLERAVTLLNQHVTDAMKGAK